MLDRNNLVRQFELVVKQEIKNHQDSMLATNLAINEVRKLIGELSERCDRKYAKLDSDRLSDDMCYRNLIHSLDEFRFGMQSRMNDSESLGKRLTERVNDTQNGLQDCVSMQVVNQESIRELKSSDGQRRTGVLALSVELEQEIRNVKNYVLEIAKKVKDQILEMPSEAQAVKKELEEKMDIDKVDFTGIMREIQVYKKTVFIIEKNIENLYTQIAKLQPK